MASPNTLARQQAIPKPEVRRFVCLFCRQPRTLEKLTLGCYGCPVCIKDRGGFKSACLAVPEAIRAFLAREQDRRIMELSKA